MKTRNLREFNSAAAQAARDLRVFFFCGPDEAGTQDAARRIAALLPDAGERVELAGADLRKDPVLLGDEARSSSLFGGSSRHIVAHVQGDEAHDAVETLIGSAVSHCPVLIVAAAATDKSRTAKLLAARKDALIAMFYPPDLRDMVAIVRAMGDAAGLTMNGDIAERVARGAALDTRLARSEIAKIALFLDASAQNPRAVTPEALAAIGANTEEDGFAPVVNAVLGGQTDALAGEIRRIREMGLNPVGLVLAIERRAAQLAVLAAKMGASGDVGSFIEAQGKAIFFKERADIENQLRRWRGKALERLVARLVELHRALLTHSQDAELLLNQGLTEIARAAAARSRR